MRLAPRDRLATAFLYLVCEELPDAHLRAALAGGVDLVQLRMKSGDDELIVATAAHYASVCAQFGALLIVNDRPDLAVRAGADGVHVGQGDMAVDRARALVGPDRIIGLSASAPAELDLATAGDADYIGVGPIYSTPTKPEQGGVGIELVGYAAQHASKPFFVIGGIDEHNVGAIVAAGARGIAVVRALAEADDPERAARRLRAWFTPGAQDGATARSDGGSP